jgi:hypothetical protein
MLTKPIIMEHQNQQSSGWTLEQILGTLLAIYVAAYIFGLILVAITIVGGILKLIWHFTLGAYFRKRRKLKQQKAERKLREKILQRGDYLSNLYKDAIELLDRYPPTHNEMFNEIFYPTDPYSDEYVDKYVQTWVWSTAAKRLPPIIILSSDKPQQQRDNRPIREIVGIKDMLTRNHEDLPLTWQGEIYDILVERLDEQRKRKSEIEQMVKYR